MSTRETKLRMTAAERRSKAIVILEQGIAAMQKHPPGTTLQEAYEMEQRENRSRELSDGRKA